ncbi:MAG: hypothetical protein HC825_04325 [Oscillatoriales cyanobacterium RM1_1_9]|nr:hypothetical protein [Oscillatoriales cyanobacterium SM2_3_0]NJO47200.1 hypothetical protein [Oscillatoriales cyanobacterium RM2_1_1]NJO71127.1 hypothetical protein [Oscillatoriales cyanobacterium RM1_1_9]
MKIGNLVATVALTIGGSLGFLAESASAASLIFNQVSGSRADTTVVNYDFTLFPTVEDRSVSNIARGFFEGAIADFTGLFEDLDNSFAFDTANVTIPTLDLRTRLLNPEGRLELILQGNRLRNQGITELALIIDDFSVASLDTLSEQQEAVNSLQYIVENELLGLISGIRVSGPSSDGTGTIVSTLGPAINPGVDTIVIPESSPGNALLTMGLIGAGLGLKRRIQMQ